MNKLITDSNGLQSSFPRLMYLSPFEVWTLGREWLTELAEPLPMEDVLSMRLQNFSLYRFTLGPMIPRNGD